MSKLIKDYLSEDALKIYYEAKKFHFDAFGDDESMQPPTMIAWLFEEVVRLRRSVRSVKCTMDEEKEREREKVRKDFYEKLWKK